jgi:cytochrome c oxidase assembly protein subunit 15
MRRQALREAPSQPMAVAEKLKVLEAEAPAVAAPAGIAAMRSYFALLSLLALVAFVLGVENRFTATGLFVLPPPVDFLPPLTGEAWSRAFAVHQQDPAFAACGGTETLAQFRLLYWWEWARRASVLALTLGVAAGLYGAGISQRFRAALPRLAGLAALAAAWWPARLAVELATEINPNLSSFNVGQYRHAVDLAFASIAIAVVVASALVPPRPPLAAASRPNDRAEWFWIAAIVLDICFGALFASCNAAASWPSWPGYDHQVLPPLSQLTSYTPWWLNLTFNPYGIQLAHRAVSTALWITAAWQLGAVLLRRRRASRALARFALISAQAASGVATLLLGIPAPLSIVHQVGGIILLAASLAFLLIGRAKPVARKRRIVSARPEAVAIATSP